MTPAINVRLLEQTDAPAARLLALPQRFAATLLTLDGKYITAGLADVDTEGSSWRARVRHLDRPGVIASMYFSEGIRQVLLRLDDGRRGVAQITGTSFLAGSQRVCDLRGQEALA